MFNVQKPNTRGQVRKPPKGGKSWKYLKML